MDSYDVPVPAVNTWFSHWSSKNEAGEYHTEGELHEVFSGVVYAVEYYITEFGTSIHDATVAGFIRVRLREPQEPFGAAGPELKKEIVT